jgi:DNA-binding MltR family transcriptional regulator
VEFDDRLKRLSMVMDSLRNAMASITDENVKALVSAIVSDTDPAGEVDVRLKPFMPQA